MLSKVKMMNFIFLKLIWELSIKKVCLMMMMETLIFWINNNLDNNNKRVSQLMIINLRMTEMTIKIILKNSI